MNKDKSELEVRNKKNWVILSVHDRIDAFNYEAFRSQVAELVESGRKNLAFDLSRARFLSLPSIKYLSSLATDLKRNGGDLALLKASERLKRQIDIYASLNPMSIAKSETDLD